MSDPMPGEEIADQGRLVCPGQASRPTIRDVSRAYRLFLGREVENVGVAGHHIAGSTSVWDLIERVYLSGEAKNRTIGAVLSDIGTFHQRTAGSETASVEQLRQLQGLVQQSWEAHGLGIRHQWLRRDEPRYDARSERWNIERSIAAGEEEARVILEICERHAYPLEGVGIFATLGAEAFRLAGALSPLIGQYLGIEISDDAHELADRAFAVRPIANARISTLSEFREDETPIDIFYSVMTLQHAPPPVIVHLLEISLAKVRPGGLALFQLPSHLHEYEFDVERYLAAEGRDPHGEIHAVPQRQILALLRSQDFTVLEVVPDGRVQSLGISYFYVARKA